MGAFHSEKRLSWFLGRAAGGMMVFGGGFGVLVGLVRGVFFGEGLK